MLAPLLLAAALTAAQPTPEASPNRRIEHGTVVQVSPRPAAGSGVLAIYADFEVATPAGARLRMYVLWMGGSQYLPDVGAVCAISYRHEPLAPGNWHDHNIRGVGRDDGPHNVVSELSCGPPFEQPRSNLLAAPLPERVPVPTDIGFFPWAHVVRVSPPPGVVSGSIIQVRTDFDVQTLDGHRHQMQMLYLSPDQFIPPAGSICWIRFRPGRPFPGVAMEPVNDVDALACDTGTETVNFADGRSRIDGIRISAAPAIAVSGARRQTQARDYVEIALDAPGRGMDRVLVPRRLAAAGVPPAGAICSITFHYDWFPERSPRYRRVRQTLIEPVADALDCAPAPPDS